MMIAGYYLKGLRGFFDFEGRASRAEFWWFTLVMLFIQYAIGILAVVVSPISSAFETVLNVMLWVHGWGVTLPQMAVLVRRLHDTGRSGWWFFIIAVPILGWVVLPWFLLVPGDVGRNKYGREPGS